MKSIKVIIGLICIVSGTLLFKTYYKETKIIEGIKYKITVGGVSQASFPVKNDSRGPFTVTTDCGATVSNWDYSAWKLNIDDSTSSTTCNISFTTRKSNDYLNSYIISNVGTIQGKSSAIGQIVNEGLASLVSLNSNATMTSLSSASDYGTAEYNSSGGQISSKYTFSNYKWSNTTTMSSWTYNKITIPENGYYQLYWTNTNTSSSYKFYIYKPNSTTIATSGYNLANEQIYDCGYLNAGDYINIAAKSETANQVIFYLKKTADYSVQNVHRGYRYEGSDPYNYVLFNNELWRVIGVFAFDKSTNQESGSTSTLDCSTYNCYTKIIRNESIGSYAFSALGTSASAVYSYWEKTDGTKATLNTLLNTYYYNATDGTGQSVCRFYGNTVTRDCDFSKKGIQEEYRPMVQNVVWNLGGYSTATNTQAMYGYERGTKECSSCTDWKTTASGYIGLMYPSDYGYSVLANDGSTSCSRTGVNLSAYNTAACGGKAWVFQGGCEWSITPSTSYAYYVRSFDGAGFIAYQPAGAGNAVRPVLYLSSDVYIVQGSGTQSDPYVLGM